MKQIPLSKGYAALIDDEDYERVSKYSWSVRVLKGKVYTSAYMPVEGKRKKIYLHRFIMNMPTGFQVDHVDGNGLNNCRSNLRLCTSTQNHANCGPHSDNTSGYKGVSWSKKYKKWTAQICHNKHTQNLLYYATPEDAARAYDKKAKELFGEFAYLNFPEEPVKTRMSPSLYQDYEEPDTLLPWQKQWRCGKGHFVKNRAPTRAWVDTGFHGKHGEPVYKLLTTEKVPDTVEMWCETCKEWFTVGSE